MNENFSQNPNQSSGTPPSFYYGQPPAAPPPPPPPGGYYAPPPPPPSQQRRNYWWIILAIIGGLILLTLIGIFAFIAVTFSGGTSEHGKHIALIRVNGVITSGRGGAGLFSGSVAGSDDIIDQLEKARENDSAKAVVLRIDSPGGSPAASEEVYNEIKRVQRAGKPVYTSMADVAASGGYYIASASDKIYADASTITGSIGVIWDSADLSGLYKKIGYTPEVVKSGKFKDIGSPNRPITPAERALIQGMIMDTYDQFVHAVASGRHMPVSQVKSIADGRVFTGRQALGVDLVDKIGGLHDTVRSAARAGGIKGEPKVIEYRRRTTFADIFSSDSSEKFSGDAERVIGREVINRLLSDNTSPGLR